MQGAQIALPVPAMTMASMISARCVGTAKPASAA